MYINILYIKRRIHVLCMILASASVFFYSCQSDDQEDAAFSEFDPSQPVVVTGFTPESGGAGQRLVIYGKNFGTDPSIVTVLIGGKEAKVISVNGESLYCLVPTQAFDGDIEVRIGDETRQVSAYADTNFDYQRKMVVSTVVVLVLVVLVRVLICTIALDLQFLQPLMSLEDYYQLLRTV